MTDWMAPTTSVEISDHARQHPEHYGLRKTMWNVNGIVHVELALMDAEGNFVDEAGCNCDLDSPCNNPGCVMERTRYEGNHWR